MERFADNRFPCFQNGWFQFFWNFRERTDRRQFFVRESSSLLSLYPVFQRIDAGKKNNNDGAGYQKDHQKETKPCHALNIQGSSLNDTLILSIALSIKLIETHINVSGYKNIDIEVFGSVGTLFSV